MIGLADRMFWSTLPLLKTLAQTGEEPVTWVTLVLSRQRRYRMATSNRPTESQVAAGLEMGPGFSTKHSPSDSAGTDAAGRQLILKCPFSVEHVGSKHTLKSPIVKKLYKSLSKMGKVTRPIFGDADFYLELDSEEANLVISFAQEGRALGCSKQLRLNHESPQEFIARALGYLEKGMEAKFSTEIGDQELIPKFRQLAHEIGANKLTAVISDGVNEVEIDMSPLDQVTMETEAPTPEFIEEKGRVTSLCTNGFILDHRLCVLAPKGKRIKVSIGDWVKFTTKTRPSQIRCFQLESTDEIVSSKQLSIIPEENN